MCGIVGVAGAITWKSEKAFKDLLIADVVRGRHSTGIASVKANGSVVVGKRAVLPHDLLELPQGKEALAGVNRVLIGHNRYATVGGVSNATAHPFQHGQITGVHNGTLKNTNPLPQSAYFDVDSDNIMFALSQQSVAKTVEQMNGAYALVWFDESDKTLNFIRNDERTLFFCYSDDRKLVWWASEEKMLEWVLDRNDIEHSPILSLVPFTHYSLGINGVGNAIKPFDKIHVKDLSAHEYVSPFRNTPSKKHGGGQQKSSNALPKPSTNHEGVLVPYYGRVERGDKVLFKVDKVEVRNKRNDKVEGHLLGKTTKVRMFIPPRAPTVSEYDRRGLCL